MCAALIYSKPIRMRENHFWRWPDIWNQHRMSPMDGARAFSVQLDWKKKRLQIGMNENRRWKLYEINICVIVDFASSLLLQTQSDCKMFGVHHIRIIFRKVSNKNVVFFFSDSCWISHSLNSFLLISVKINKKNMSKRLMTWRIR